VRESIKEEISMRGWIILDSMMALAGLGSMAWGRQLMGSAVSLGALGLVLLALALCARMVRGRA